MICLRTEHKVKEEDKLDEILNEEIQQKYREEDDKMQKSSSLYIFAYQSLVRRVTRIIVKHRVFESIILVIIIISFAQLALDSPLNDPNSSLSYALSLIDYLTTSMFILEALLKIISNGFINCGSTSYIRNYWNIVDLLIIIITISSYLSAGSNVNAIKVFRLLKVLRPLRLLSRNESLKVSIQALGMAMGGVITILVITMLFCYIFGIIGINYFRGKLFSCHSELYSILDSVLDNKWDCLNQGGRWVNSDLNFDNIANSMSTLLVLANAVSWSEVMYQTSYARGVDLVAGTSISGSLAPIFFIAAIVIGNFFLMNLFIGVIITAYNRENEIGGKDFMLTEKQHKWVLQKIMII